MKRQPLAKSSESRPVNYDGSRCQWTRDDVLMNEYHDHEWGVPLRDAQKLFEFLVLDAFQAGLSWRTVLYKRENFRRAFDGFNPERIAKYGSTQVAKLLRDEGIIRNRAKVAGTIKNARAFLEFRRSGKSFAELVWQSVKGKPKVNRWRKMGELPARTKESDFLSALLKENGFVFVGSTICYAFMQAAGLVNDHVISCPRFKAVLDLSLPSRPSRG